MAVAAAALWAMTGAWTPCVAQDGAPPPGPVEALRSSAELDQLLGPIALYPDPLVGIILPAATQPSQIVMADRYISQGGDPGQIAQQPLDPGVQGLAHYPNVLKWMDDNLTWTTELGQAFLNQQTDVMDSVQRLRAQAQALGNLQNTPQENVVSDDGTIDIEPADPNEIYVPEYQPETIYYQSGVYCSFGIGLPIGGWLGYDWDWRHHHLITWGPSHPRPQDWWRSPPAARIKEISHDPNLWHPRAQPGSLIVRGGDRGYEVHPVARAFVPKVTAPRAAARPAEAPHTSVTIIGRSKETSRAPEPARAPEVSRAPAVARPAQRSEPSESAFGGSQSSREVRESSSRGQESRSSGGASEPSRSGGSSGRGH